MTESITARLREYGPGQPHGKKLILEAADEIARLTGEVERLTRLDRANHAAIDILQANPDAFQHFECATIIDNMKSKADALAEAVKFNLIDLRAVNASARSRNEIEPVPTDTIEELQAALTAYRDK